MKGKTILIILVIVIILAAVAFFAVKMIKKSSDDVISDYTSGSRSGTGKTSGGSGSSNVNTGNDRATGSGLNLHLTKEKKTIAFKNKEAVKKLQNHFATLEDTKDKVGTVDGVIGPKFCECAKILLDKQIFGTNLILACKINEDYTEVIDE